MRREYINQFSYLIMKAKFKDYSDHCCPEKFYHKVSCLFESFFGQQ